MAIGGQWRSPGQTTAMHEMQCNKMWQYLRWWYRNWKSFRCVLLARCLVSGLFLVSSNIWQSESMRWLFLQIFGTDCVIVEDWVDKTGSPSSSNIKDESAFKWYFPFLQPTLSHPGGGVRRLLSSYCSAGQNNSTTNTKYKTHIQIQNTNTWRMCQKASQNY